MCLNGLGIIFLFLFLSAWPDMRLEETDKDYKLRKALYHTLRNVISKPRFLRVTRKSGEAGCLILSLEGPLSFLRVRRGFYQSVCACTPPGCSKMSLVRCLPHKAGGKQRKTVGCVTVSDTRPSTSIQLLTGLFHNVYTLVGCSISNIMLQLSKVCASYNFLR